MFEMSTPRHLVSVWNPSYAQDAMDAHLEVLLGWAERASGEDDTYVWWAKLRSGNRQQPLPHRAEILALEEQIAAGHETHLYLTDYRSLYVAHVDEITSDDLLADGGEEDHMPLYYRGQAADFWFRLLDIRLLVSDDTVATIEELKRLRNVRYHDRPVSLYGGSRRCPGSRTEGRSRAARCGRSTTPSCEARWNAWGASSATTCWAAMSGLSWSRLPGPSSRRARLSSARGGTIPASTSRGPRSPTPRRWRRR
jgi:hypothetical protein